MNEGIFNTLIWSKIFCKSEFRFPEVFIFNLGIEPESGNVSPLKPDTGSRSPLGLESGSRSRLDTVLIVVSLAGLWTLLSVINNCNYLQEVLYVHTACIKNTVEYVQVSRLLKLC